jgi:hypothetical protein
MKPVTAQRRSREQWEEYNRLVELAEVISGQMAMYMAEGKGLKAGRILSKIRLRLRRKS